MKMLVWLLCLMLTIPMPAWAGDYRLRYGDAIRITVVDHPELTMESLAIRPDGKIALPLVPELFVQGKTVSQVTSELTKTYEAVLSRPQVVVSVVKFRPLRVTVLGQVHRPGTYAFEEPPAITDALANAEGLTKRAVRSAIKVVSPGGAIATYDLDRLLSNREKAPPLEEGSVIEVGEIWGPDLDQGILLFTSLVGSAIFLIRR